MITLLLLVRTTYSICMVLFFTHIPFVVNHTINATPPERLQQYQYVVLNVKSLTGKQFQSLCIGLPAFAKDKNALLKLQDYRTYSRFMKCFNACLHCFILFLGTLFSLLQGFARISIIILDIRQLQMTPHLTFHR